MTTVAIPQDEGQLSPREAQAWVDMSIDPYPNRASDKLLGPRALAFVQHVLKEHSDKMRPLHMRWRATYHMLAGNTLERTGPADVHVPELYKAMETIIPRIEEAIIEKDPWFRVIPRREQYSQESETVAAYIDYQFDRAKVRDLIQPAARDMLVTQVAAFYVKWKVKEEERDVRSVERVFKGGEMKRKVKTERKNVISYYGPDVKLVDPFDFIIDTKATNPQDAIYVGHRVMMSIDEIKTLGEQFGWSNLDKVEELAKGSKTAGGIDSERYRWTRDPTARYGDSSGQFEKVDGRPSKVEVSIIYARFAPYEGADYDEFRMVCAGGKVMLEVRENFHEGKIRPYATARASKNGHEFYGTGPFDNAVRLNQHADRLYQIQMRSAEVAGGPLVFAEEDSDLPDSLYGVRPFSVFKGVGAVRFTQVSDGAIGAVQNAIGSLQRNIEETVGAFRIQMGQDSNGTATEASLSLQEGNRRLRGLIRSMGDGLGQLLEVIYAFNQKMCIEDEMFPVLGKRAIDLRKSHMTLSPADLISDVKFDLLGLHSLRTYGLRATGLQSFMNSMGPLIMANPNAVNQPMLMHEFAKELIGPEEADQLVKVPTPLENLRSQEEENEGLITGTEIAVDPEDDHEAHMQDLMPLFKAAVNPDSKMEIAVRRVVISHYESHRYHLNKQAAQQSVLQKRASQQGAGLPPEAGGQAAADGSGRSSPVAGGMSDAMSQLAGSPGGQTPGENPGPADPAKFGRMGRAGRTTNQTENLF